MLRPASRQALGLLVVVAVAVALRLIHFLEIQHAPFFRAPVIDAAFYHELAQALARGEGTGRAPFMMPPLYPLVLSALYRVAGVDLVLAHALQFVFGTLTTILTFFVAQRLAGLTVAVVAGLLVATNRTLLFVEGDVLATPLAVFLDLVFVFFMVRFHDSDRRRDVAAAALALGLAALARPPALVVLPFFAVWLGWRRARPRLAVVFVLLALAPLLPVAAHNQRASGEWVWISANGGINFWIGNNPDMRRTVALRPGPEWRRMNDLPLRQEGRITPVQRDRWFWRAGLQAMAADPVAAASRLAEKAVLLVHEHEIMRDVDFYAFRERYGSVLWLPTGSLTFLLSLALIGTFLARPRPAALSLVWCFVGPYALSIVAFFVTARYRAPLLPLLAMPAALGLVWCVQAVRDRRMRSIVQAVVVAALVACVSVPDWLGVDAVDEVEWRYRVGTALETSGDLDAALAAYEGVLERDPDHALAAARAAGCQQQLGHVQEAVQRYESVLDRHPDYVEVMLNLANLAWRFGDAAAAHGYYSMALETDPWYAQSYGYYGMFLASRGEHRDALRLFAEAQRLDPAWELLRLEVARSLLALGEARAAGVELERLPASLRERDARVLELQGDVQAQLGHALQAQDLWRRALAIEPRNVRLQEKLRQGRGN